MLTGKLVRVRVSKNKVLPIYLDTTDRDWRESAEHLLEVFRGLPGHSRAEMEEEIRETIGDNPSQLVPLGLAKLLEDRCVFEVDAALDPEKIRDQVFLAAGRARRTGQFDRAAIIGGVAQELSAPPEHVDAALFADLKSEQRVVSFEDMTVNQLLDRYNVALAQAVLLRSTGVTVRLSGETPQRYRQLFRAIKFHHLICRIESAGKDAYVLHLDGPLSLFSATQKYGVQLACFLPHLVQCKRFDLTAQVRWGVDRKDKVFLLSHSDDLRSHLVDHGSYVPKDLQMFAESFRKSAGEWELSDDVDIVSLPSGPWVPDFQLVHRRTGKVIRLDVLGFWRRSDADRLYRRLSTECKEPFILAVSQQLNIDEADEPEWGNNIYRFKRSPLPGEVIKLANALVR